MSPQPNPIQQSNLPGFAIGDVPQAGGTPANLGQSNTLAIDPSDVGFDVILLAGQSNMCGGDPLGEIDANQDPVDSRIWCWPGNGSYFGRLIQAKDPLPHHSQPLAVGPGMPLARAYAASRPSNRRVLLVPCAHSGTGFTTTDFIPRPGGFAAGGGCWDPDYPNGTNLYQFAIAQTLAAVAAAPGVNRIAGVFWHQGEADASNNMTKAAYAAKLDELLNGFRTAFAIPDLWFVIGQMLPEYRAGTANAVLIDQAHVETQARQQNVGFVYSLPELVAGSDTFDNLHYISQVQRQWGPSWLRGLQLAKVNLLGVAPAVPLNVKIKQTGIATATVTWTPGLGRATDYKIEINIGMGWSAIAHTPTPYAQIALTGLAAGQIPQIRVSAINEIATSDASYASLLMLAVPAQVTGVASTAVGGGSQSLIWNPVPQASSYLVEYKLTSSGTWLTYSTVLGTSAQVLGLIPLTSYDYRVTAINDAGPGPASATFTNSTVAVAPLLNDVAVAAYHAFSTRKVNPSPAYNGPCMDVRRSSDNAIATIAWDANGSLDQTALLAHTGGGSGFVSKWYDQSGNGRDVIQTTTTLQPRIVNAGVVDTSNSRPAINFLGTTYLGRVAPSGLYNADGASSLIVETINAIGNNISVAESKAGSTNLSRWIPTWFSTGGINWTIAVENPAGTGVQLIANSVGPAPVDSALHQLSGVDSGTAVSGYLDSVAHQNQQPYTLPRQGVYNGDVFGIGAWVTAAAAASFFFTGKLCEVVTFDSVLPDTVRITGERNEKSYYGTP